MQVDGWPCFLVIKGSIESAKKLIPLARSRVAEMKRRGDASQQVLRGPKGEHIHLRVEPLAQAMWITIIAPEIYHGIFGTPASSAAFSARTFEESIRSRPT